MLPLLRDMACQRQLAMAPLARPWSFLISTCWRRCFYRRALGLHQE